MLQELSTLRKEAAVSAESCSAHQREILQLSEELSNKDAELQRLNAKFEEERSQRSRVQGDLASTLEIHRTVTIKTDTA